MTLPCLQQSPVRDCKKAHFFFFLAILRGLWDLLPNEGLDPGPQLWKRGVLTTRLPGNPENAYFFPASGGAAAGVVKGPGLRRQTVPTMAA